MAKTRGSRPAQRPVALQRRWGRSNRQPGLRQDEDVRVTEHPDRCCDLSRVYTFHSVHGSSLVNHVLVRPSMMERVVHMGVVHAGFSDHDALIVQVHHGRPMDCTPPVVRPPRWLEEVLPLYADGFLTLTNQANEIARADVMACGVLCVAFNKLIRETYGRVWVCQKVASDASVRRPQSRYTLPYAHRVSLQWRALHAAARRSPGSQFVSSLRADYRRCLQRYRRRQRVTEAQSLTGLMFRQPAAFWKRYKRRTQLPDSISHAAWHAHSSA